MSKHKRHIIVSSSEDEDEDVQRPRPKKPTTSFLYGGEDCFTYYPLPYSPGIRTDSGTHCTYIQLDSVQVISDSDDEENDYLTSGSSDERWPLCNIRGCFLEEITLPTSIYTTNFPETKQELAKRLYQLYNSTIFENKLPENMRIVWNKRLTRSSAYCSLKSENDQRYCVINLSEKVCDSAERVRDTLVHEMCHAACWLIDKKLDTGQHGPLWKAHAANVTKVHPELPKVEVYHDYNINFPFTYRCSLCQCSIGRYRKITAEKVYCNYCKIRIKDESPSSSSSIR